MKALVLVDIQNDFLPDGALAVPDGDQVVPVANRLIGGGSFDLVIATQDWHPANHGSFAGQYAGGSVGDVIDLNGLRQILWPDHCVQGTGGAELAPTLNTGGIDEIFRKGTDVAVDSYSGFFDNARRKATGLAQYLTARRVCEVYVMGLATDYCVKFTALDAVSLGFAVHLIEDGCRGVDVREGDVAKAIEEMTRAGVVILTSNHLTNAGKAV